MVWLDGMHYKVKVEGRVQCRCVYNILSELLFKRMKQNYPLKYFLGDSENGIQIPIWCSLIAGLILKIIKKGAAGKRSFSNLAAMVRIHLMTYIDLGGFLRSPEKALMKMARQSKQYDHNQLLLIT